MKVRRERPVAAAGHVVIAIDEFELTFERVAIPRPGQVMSLIRTGLQAGDGATGTAGAVGINRIALHRLTGVVHDHGLDRHDRLARAVPIGEVKAAPLVPEFSYSVRCKVPRVGHLVFCAARSCRRIVTSASAVGSEPPRLGMPELS